MNNLEISHQKWPKSQPQHSYKQGSYKKMCMRVWYICLFVICMCKSRNTDASIYPGYRQAMLVGLWQSVTFLGTQCNKHRLDFSGFFIQYFFTFFFFFLSIFFFTCILFFCFNFILFFFHHKTYYKQNSSISHKLLKTKQFKA